MTAQQLRNSILQQAIQGRLVPQDPNDEPASVLLERIRKEKEQLVKEGKLKKKDLATTPIADDEKPFDLPSGWNWCHIGDVCEILNGYAFKSGNYVDSGIRIMRISNVQAGVIVDKDPKFYPLSSEADIKDYVLKEGDMLMSLTGNVGRVGILKADMLPAALNQRVACLRLHNEEIKPFFYHYLQSEIFRMRCESSGHGMAQLNISTEWLKQELIPLPPLAEQRRIVAKIEELMPLVEKYGKAQTELDTLNQDLPRRLRQSVLQQAIQGKLVEQDEKDEWSNIFVSKLPKKKYKTNAEWPCEEPFDLPSGWNWCHIGDVCEILNGYAFKSGNYVDSGIRIMRISNVQAGVIVDKDPKFYPLSSEADIKDYVLKEGDMLMSLTGNVGRVGILKADMLPAALNQRVACLRLHNEEIKPFFYHYLQSEIFRMRCESSGHGMAQLNISTEWLKQELIPLPPLAEQRRIVAKIEELFAEIDKLK